MRDGITVAGNIIVDQLYAIHKFPSEGELSQIDRFMARSTGGALCNVIMDLARLDPDLPLQAIGKIGKDDNGQFVLNEFKKYRNIQTEEIGHTDTTGYTLVMNNQNNKERTFFSYMGANEALDEDFFDIDKINAKIFHIGYISLLAALDKQDETYQTALARLLYKVQNAGCKTSIDVVSDSAQSYKYLAQSALKYTNFCIINELEAQGITGIQLRDNNGQLVPNNFLNALQKLKSFGVKDWIVVHAPEISFGIDQCGNTAQVDVELLDKKEIVDNVGAGDAFCSGVLLGAYRNKSLEEAIRMGILSARYSLQGVGAVSGITKFEEM